MNSVTPTRTHRALDTVFRLLYPGEESVQDSPRLRRETRAFAAALIAALVALVTGLIAFHGPVPLWGAVSPGSVGLVLAACAAAVTSVVEHLRSPIPPVPGWRPAAVRAQAIVNALAIALVHAGIAILLVGLTTSVLMRGFMGLQVDAFTSIMITVLLSAAAGYAGTLSGGDLTTARLSTLFAVFMTGGVLVAMLSTSDAEWWRLHFSELGVGESLSSIVFNSTLIVGGLLMASLGSLIAGSLTVWAAAAPPSRTRNVRLVQWAFLGVGVGLAGVGLVPVNVSLLVHNTFATGMAVVFGALLIGLRWILDGFSRVFLLFSDVVLIGIAFSALLFWPLGYYNLAAFELVAAGIIFAWLIIFLRHLDAAVPSREKSQDSPAMQDSVEA
ncbi:hypothetical protein [Leucobacter chromiireducens]|uniref:DUF998 domain-containing protein n=1 Tax=Leucobacter chromiireducens subsp. chromiireducens TaxID=660067 RepID=A0ABS1SPT8_9MICO|nr:hypothetical protein [Leucobacter chromiireducens]MBL3689994.1 hypothetical protein [Leucobacter chromiireducens subsp. chromiireducens]